MRSPTQKCSVRLGLFFRQTKTPSILRIGSITWATWPGPEKKCSWMNRSRSERKIPKSGWVWYQPTILRRGEFRIHLGVDLRPGLVGERHLGELGLGPLAADRVDDLDEWPDLVAMPAPDQHPADLDRGVLAGMLPERGVDLGGEEDAERLAPPAGEDLLRQVLTLQQPDIEFVHVVQFSVSGFQYPVRKLL